ncbi:hypothetical protein MY3957_003045 [Beauveria namnaoensis]
MRRRAGGLCLLPSKDGEAWYCDVMADVAFQRTVSVISTAWLEDIWNMYIRNRNGKVAKHRAQGTVKNGHNLTQMAFRMTDLYVVGAQFVCGVTVVGMTACGGIFTPPPPLPSPPPAYQRQVRQCIYLASQLPSVFLAPE